MPRNVHPTGGGGGGGGAGGGAKLGQILSHWIITE